MTLEQLQQQINELQQQLNLLKDEPIIDITIITAQEGYVFKRNLDGMIFGDTIHLGYDYSLGFRRVDKEIFYTQIPNPELEE